MPSAVLRRRQVDHLASSAAGWCNRPYCHRTVPCRHRRTPILRFKAIGAIYADSRVTCIRLNDNNDNVAVAATAGLLAFVPPKRNFLPREVLDFTAVPTGLVLQRQNTERSYLAGKDPSCLDLGAICMGPAQILQGGTFPTDPLGNATGDAAPSLPRSCASNAGPRRLHYSVDLRRQTYTEPVPSKYGKLTTKCPWIYGYFLQCAHTFIVGFHRSIQ